MAEHERPDSRAFFMDLWRDGDPWGLEISEYDQRRYDRQLELLGDRRYRRVLELGCGAGAFTARLATGADAVLAIDVAENALALAHARGLGGAVEFRAADIGELDPVELGTFDLVVVSETIYYLGWLRSFFELGWLARRLAEALEPGGELLLANTIVDDDHGLESPWLIRTYRDLFVNVGLRLEREELFRGAKDGEEFEALLSLFRKG
jgi:SAM-dependent methyltransferase